MPGPRKDPFAKALEDFGTNIDELQATIHEGFTALVTGYEALESAASNNSGSAPPAAVARPAAKPVGRPATSPASTGRRPAPPVVEEDVFEDDDLPPVAAPRGRGRPPGPGRPAGAAKPVGRPAAPVGRPRRAPAPEPEEEFEDPELEFDEDVETADEGEEDWEKEWVEPEPAPRTRRAAR